MAMIVTPGSKPGHAPTAPAGWTSLTLQTKRRLHCPSTVHLITAGHRRSLKILGV
ncbi:Warthog protein 8 [Clarias magur]|uniref:Warthog protein 8 n=1 Tax=Clarias magur TaxID=1594786 RepID=A0A8J4XE93_CLAMG|nr:Warthog protein 8 [Clarias magur]